MIPKTTTVPRSENEKHSKFSEIAKMPMVYNLRGDYTLLLSNFVLDITFKQIH